MVDRIEGEILTRIGQTNQALSSLESKIDGVARKQGRVNEEGGKFQKVMPAAGKVAAAAMTAAAAAAGRYLDILIRIEEKEAERFRGGAQKVGDLFGQVQGLVQSGPQAARLTETLASKRGAIDTGTITGFLGSLGDISGITGADPAQILGLVNALEQTESVTRDQGRTLAGVFGLFGEDIRPGQSDSLAAATLAIGRRGGIDKRTAQSVKRLQAGGLDRFQALGLSLALKRAQSLPAANTIAQELLRGFSLDELEAGKGSRSAQRALRQVRQNAGPTFIEDTTAEIRAAFQGGSSFLRQELDDPLIQRLRAARSAEREIELREQARFSTGAGLDAFIAEQSIKAARLDVEQQAAAGDVRSIIGLGVAEATGNIPLAGAIPRFAERKALEAQQAIKVEVVNGSVDGGQ